MACLNGGNDVKELMIEAKTENLHRVFDFVTGELSSYILQPKTVRQIKLCVEEIFLNIANYAYHPDTGFAKITVKVDNEDEALRVMISFTDKGNPFNPLSVASPDVEAELEERNVGGLGIFLVKNAVDGLAYEYTDGQNILTIEKSLATA